MTENVNANLIQTIVQSFTLHSEKYPHKDAVISDGSISYVNLNQYVNRIANCLLELDQRQLPVATFLDNGIDYVAGILGIGKSRNLFLPLELHWPKTRTADVIALAMPRVILTNPVEKPNLLALGRDFTNLLENTYLVTLAGHEQALCVEKIVKGRLAPVIEMMFSDTRPSIEVKGDDSFYLLPTSGSTGKPKIIEGLHGSLSHFLAWEREELCLGDQVRGMAMAPVSFDVSLRDIFMPLTSGGTLFIPPVHVKANPEALIRWIGDCQINLIHLVPSVIRLLIQTCADQPSLKKNLSSLRYMLSAGEPLYGSDVLGIRESINPQLTMINIYGLTETTLAKVYYRIQEIGDPHKIIPLGNPLPDTKIIIMDGERVCVHGEVGEICIQTAYPAKGFYKDKVHTQEKYQFVENGTMVRFRTNDLGQIQENGLLVYHGRMDDQIKIRGNRVELLEVEQCLMKHPGIKKVALIPQTDVEHQVSLLCFYLSPLGISSDVTEFREYLNGRLPHYMHPSQFIHMQEFPLRLNGKLDKLSLLEQGWRPLSQLGESNPPKGEVEVKLANFWREIFKTEDIYRESSFVVLGGSSLNAMRLISKIYNEFHIIL